MAHLRRERNRRCAEASDSTGAAFLDGIEGAEIAPGPGTLHNPFKDDIVVYIDPDIVDKIACGEEHQGRVRSACAC